MTMCGVHDGTYPERPWVTEKSEPDSKEKTQAEKPDETDKES
jgi:hypothetical protein